MIFKNFAKAAKKFMLKKHSRIFIFFLFLFLVLSAFLFAFSAKNHITPEKVFDAGLPVIFIDTDNGKRIKSKTEYIKADFYIYEDYKSYQEKKGLIEKGKIRGRGNTTWTFRKKPYLAKFNSEKSVLGLPPARKWVLLSLMCDKSKIRNAYATNLSKNIWTGKLWQPDFRFVNLYLNGKFDGLYCIYEKVEQGANRLNLPKDSFLFVVNSRYSGISMDDISSQEDFSSENFKPEEFDSANFGPTKTGKQKNDNWGFRSEHGVPFSLKDNHVDEKTFLRERDILQNIENQIYLEDNSKVFDYIDKESFVDWYLLQEFSKNRDSNFLASCFMFFNSKTGKLYMGPGWDFDIAFGGSHMDNNFSPEDPWINQFHWYKELWRNNEFKAAVKERWNETKGELKSSFQYIYQESDKLDQSAFLDDIIWRTIGHKQWPLTPGYKSRKTYKAEVDYVYNWCEKRSEWMDSYISQL